MSDSTNTISAPHVLLQALIETSFDVVKLAVLQPSGKLIAKRLGSKGDALDALSRLECGKENYEILEGSNGGRLVVLKNCPFQDAHNNVAPWSEEAGGMVQRFNESPRGGAAVSPICIGHLSVRDAYGAVNLGCRSTTTGKVAISMSDLLDEVGITEEKVGELLEENACLYWIK